MSELDDKLNAILSSPETMNQIMSIANSLSDSLSDSPDQSSQPSQPKENQEDSPSLSGLMSLLGGGGAGGLDPKLLGMAAELFQEYNRGDDEKAALLQAMRPFLRQEHAVRIDRAIQMTRLSRVIHLLMQHMRGEGGENV